jgi:hypothetical protein
LSFVFEVDCNVASLDLIASISMFILLCFIVYRLLVMVNLTI